MIGLESTPFNGAAAEQPHAVHVVSVRLRYVSSCTLAFERKGASTCTSVYVILILKCYGVNKHNLLTTSYFFDESGCEYSWISGYQRKSRVLKSLWFLFLKGWCQSLNKDVPLPPCFTTWTLIILTLLWRRISIQLTNTIYFIILTQERPRGGMPPPPIVIKVQHPPPTD